MTPSAVSIVGVGDTKASLKLEPGKIVLGRSLKELNCTDKKVSREHAYIELEKDGKVWLTAAHINPCFIHGDDGPRPLKKGDRHCLTETDKFSLLPNQYMYKISFGDQPSSSTASRTSSNKTDESYEESEDDDDDDEDEDEEEMSEESESESESEDDDDEDDEDYGSKRKKRPTRSSSGSSGVKAGRRSTRAAAKKKNYSEDFEPSSGSDWEEDRKKRKKA